MSAIAAHDAFYGCDPQELFDMEDQMAKILHPVPDSSTIQKLEHDSDGNVLTVHFKSGGVYQYPGVSASEFEALRTAPSVGKHFHAHIKSAKTEKGEPRFPAKKVS